MSDRGWWGDKVIIELHSDDGRRHKKWCEYYDSESKYCQNEHRMCKCAGAAHCEYYKQLPGVGAQRCNVAPEKVITVYVPDLWKKEEKGEKLPSPVKKPPVYLPGHFPPFGERLTGKIVVIDKLTSIDFGLVIFDDHDIIKVERDDGTVVMYERKTAIRKKTFWVVDDIKDGKR